MGRNPKPNSVKKAEGTFRKDRATRPVIERKLAEVPEPPFQMNDEQAGVFRYLCEDLRDRGLLSVSDVHQLAMLACEIVRVWDLYKVIERLDPTKTEYMRVLNAINKTIALINRVGRGFGFDAYSRQLIKRWEDDEQEDDIEDAEFDL